MQFQSAPSRGHDPFKKPLIRTLLEIKKIGSGKGLTGTVSPYMLHEICIPLFTFHSFGCFTLMRYVRQVVTPSTHFGSFLAPILPYRIISFPVLYYIIIFVLIILMPQTTFVVNLERSYISIRNLNRSE